MSSGGAKEWTNFEIRRIEKEDTQRVLACFRKNFFGDEVLNNLLGSEKCPDRIRDTETAVTMAITEGLCLMMLDKETKEVVGVQIMYINSIKKMSIYTSFVLVSPISHRVRRFLKSDFDVHDRYGVSEYAHIGYTVVDKEYRGQGIGSELWKQSINICKEMNLPVIASFCTGPLSQKIAVKAGFQEVWRKYYVELLKDTSVALTREPSPDEFGAEMVLKLSLD